MIARLTAFAIAAVLVPTLALAEDLYNGSPFAAIATDQRAHAPGDVLTVIVYQSAEARNAAQNSSRQGRTFDGALSAGSTEESAALSLDSAYAGRGEVRRSESLITQVSVTVREVLANGDLLVEGEQQLALNGERTTVRIRGRVRPADINGDNQVLSFNIADAQISYDGRGFVSRNARPNWLHRLFSLLGLGG
jgi:flagellar L-ring protein precursor FlgH